MPIIRKRRATQAEPPNEDNASSGSDVPPNRNNTRRRRTDGNNNSPEDSDASGTGYNETGIQAPDSTDAMVKKMVRFAIASEYSRQPMRRKDISTKVLGEQGSRQFKTVFEQAQKVLRHRFGMEMTELPAKGNLGGLSQARATQRQSQSTSTATSNKSWTLTTTLPPAYRHPSILPPPRAPSSSTESTYVALYTFLISTITLSGGSIPEQKLDRYLRRANADNYTPIDRTESLIARMVKDGYLVKNRDTEGGEEVVEYFVGPRGKVEVGDEGVEGLVRKVYGFEVVEEEGRRGGEQQGAGAGGEGREEFEMKLKRSLGLKEMASKKDANADAAGGAVAEGSGENGGGGRPGNRRGRRQADGDDDDGYMG